MVHSIGVFRIFVCKKDTGFGASNVGSLKILVEHRVSIDVPNACLIGGIMQEHFHLIGWIIWLKDNGMPILGSMINMEKLLAKVL